MTDVRRPNNAIQSIKADSYVIRGYENEQCIIASIYSDPTVR